MSEQGGGHNERVPCVQSRQGGGIPAAADAVRVEDDRRSGRRGVLELPDGTRLMARDARHGEHALARAIGQDHCRDIAKAIEEKMNYPGEIKISVIRETRYVEYAK